MADMEGTVKMKTLAVLGAASALSVAFTGLVMAVSYDTRIGKLEFTHDFANGYPSNNCLPRCPPSDFLS